MEQEQGYGDQLRNTRHFSRINALDEMRNSGKYNGKIGAFPVFPYICIYIYVYMGSLKRVNEIAAGATGSWNIFASKIVFANS